MTSADNNAAKPPEDGWFERHYDAMHKAMFDTSGRIGRARFWRRTLWLLPILLLMMAVFAPSMTSTGGTGGEGGVVMLLAIPFFWLYAKLMIERLHDLGRSGWWFALIGAVLVLLPMWMWSESHNIYFRIEQSGAAQQAIKSYVIFMEFGAYAIFLGGSMLMGFLPGTAGANDYGPDPVAPHDAASSPR